MAGRGGPAAAIGATGKVPVQSEFWGMTNFLRTDFLRERFRDIAEAAEYLDHLLTLSAPERRKLLYRYAKQGHKTTVKKELIRTVQSIAGMAGETAEFMDQLPSQPLIYTGPGDTERVIEMLEGLVATDHRKKTGSVRGED
ncbi:MAG: hypothetical protein ACYC53_06660 [Bacillota bacterium]